MAADPPDKKASESGTLDYFGSGFDESPFDAEAGGKLELDSYHPPAPAAPKPAAPGAPAPPPPPKIPLAAPAPPHMSAPIASTGAASAIQADAVALLADYGPAPRGIHLAPIYAFRVLSRQRTLMGTLKGLNNQIETTEKARDRLLADLAIELRPKLQADNRFEQHLNAIRQIESVATERGALLQQTNAAHQAQAGEIDAELKKSEADIAAAHQGERTAADDLSRKRQAHDRVAAKQKRLLIEARGLAQNPQEVAKFNALQDEAAQLQPELDQKRAEFEAANLELQRIQNQIAGMNEYARGIQAQRRALDAQFGKQLGEKSKGYHEAETQLTRALAGLGREALGSNLASGVDPTRIQEITRVEQQTARLNESREQHVQALDAYDRPMFQKGIALVAVVGIAVVLAIVLFVVL